MNISHCTYSVKWSVEDGEHVGLCAEYPSLSWLARTPEKALAGLRQVVAEVVADMQSNGEQRVPRRWGCICQPNSTQRINLKRSM